MLVEASRLPVPLAHEVICMEDRVPIPYDPLTLPWSRIGEAVMEMERFNFGVEAEPEEKIRWVFENPESIISFIRNTRLGRPVVGFSAVVPATTEYTFPDWEFPGRLHEGRDLSATAYVHCTQFANDHQGLGLVKGLNEQMLERVTAAGYTHLERDASRKGPYADNLSAIYRSQIIEWHNHVSIKFGPQRFLRQALQVAR